MDGPSVDPGQPEEVLREAKLIPKKMWDEVHALTDSKLTGAPLSWAHSSALEAMVKLAAAGEINVREEDLKVDIAALDRNREVLNTPTGIVDLKTGALLDHEEHKREYCTRMTSVGYVKNASTKGWEAFLKEFSARPRHPRRPSTSRGCCGDRLLNESDGLPDRHGRRQRQDDTGRGVEGGARVIRRDGDGVDIHQRQRA